MRKKYLLTFFFLLLGILILLLLSPSINVRSFHGKGLDLDFGWVIQQKGELPKSGGPTSCTAVVLGSSTGFPFSVWRSISASGCGPVNIYINYVAILLDIIVYGFSFVFIYKVIQFLKKSR